jgi:AraC-like DNA-binding protein
MTLRPTAAPRTEFLRSAHLAETEFLVSDVNSTAWHAFHERYVVCSVDEASAPTRYRGKDEWPFNGATMLMEPGETHRNLVVPRPQNFRVVFFEPALFERAAQEHGLRRTPHFRAYTVGDPQLMSAVYRLCAAVDAQETVLELQSRLAVCLRLALAHTEQSPPALKADHNYAAVECARTYLQERFDEAVSLDELAANARLSPYHLVRSFTRRFGLPPHAYQIHIRVERARAPLAAGVPLAEVASSAGFADQSHFTRHFKRIMNATPANYAGIPR